MKHIFFTFFAALATTSLLAQQENNIVDEVIWLVGDEAILKSEVEEQRLRAQFDGVKFENDPYCVIPEQIAIQKLFLHQASIDSISANESEVIQNVEERLNYFIEQLGSKEKVEEQFKKSFAEIREELRDVLRDQLVIETVRRNLMGNITSTPAEIRRYFNALNKDSIPTVAAQVELQIVSLTPAVPLEEIARTKERLREFSERVNNGTSTFSMLARLYSEDTGSAKRGGELGLSGRGRFVPEFAAVAFSLTDPEKVSRIVETELGFHILQLIEKLGDRINVRHILLKPHISSADREKATKQMDSIAKQIRENKLTFEQAVLRFSQDKNTAMNAGLMLNKKTASSKFEYQDLPAEVAKIAYTMNVNEISKPFSMIDPATNKEIVAVVKLKSKTDAHKATINEDYQLLKSLYEDKLRADFISNWIRKKQKETYIKIDPKWSNCEFEYEGWIKK